MEPHNSEPSKPVSAPAPIMDVAPPPKSEAALAEPPKEAGTVSVEETKSKPKKPIAQKPPKTSSAPALAITLAIIFFLALSALAYYAYSQGK